MTDFIACPSCHDRVRDIFETSVCANQVKTPIQNYFEKVLYENLTFEIPPLWFLELSVEG